MTVVWPPDELGDVLDGAEGPESQAVSTAEAVTSINAPIKAARRRFLTTMTPLSCGASKGKVRPDLGG